MVHGFCWTILRGFGLMPSDINCAVADRMLSNQNVLRTPATSTRLVNALRIIFFCIMYAISLMAVLRQVAMGFNRFFLSESVDMIILLLKFLRYQARSTSSLIILTLLYRRRHCCHNICLRKLELQLTLQNICGHKTTLKLMRRYERWEKILAVGSVAVFFIIQCTNDCSWYVTSPEFSSEGIQVWPFPGNWNFLAFVVLSYCSEGLVVIGAQVVVALFCSFALFSTINALAIKSALSQHPDSCVRRIHQNQKTIVLPKHRLKLASVEDIHVLRSFISALKQFVNCVEKEFSSILFFHIMPIMFISLAEMCAFENNEMPDSLAWIGALNDGTSMVFGLGFLVGVPIGFSIWFQETVGLFAASDFQSLKLIHLSFQ